MSFSLTSYPVMAMRCMESFTAFRIPRMEDRASCRSSQPAHPLLYFNISCTTRGESGADYPSLHTYSEFTISTSDLEQQLVLGDSLHRLKEVGVQTQFMLQLFLALLNANTNVKLYTESILLLEAHNRGNKSDLEEGTVRALSPQALRARFVLTVGFIDLQVLHLKKKQGFLLYSWHNSVF